MNNKQKKNARKKSSVVIASSVAIGAATAAAIGTGVALNQENKTISENQAAVVSPVNPDNADKLLVINSANVLYPTDSLRGKQPNIGAFQYNVAQPTFYTIFEYIQADFNIKKAVELALSRAGGVTISGQSDEALNGTYLAADWDVEEFDWADSSFGKGARLVKKASATSFNGINRIEIFDKSIYYTTPVDITENKILFNTKENGTKVFEDVKKYSDFLKSLDSITPESDRASNKRLLRVNNLVYEKIQSFVSSSFELTEVGINKETRRISDTETQEVLFISGRNSSGDFVVYTLGNLPLIYNYENFYKGKNNQDNQLPGIEEVYAANYDYKQAIYDKIQSLAGPKIFDNKINKSAITSKDQIEIISDGTIILTDNTDAAHPVTVYITQGQEGYKYHRLDRAIDTSANDSEFPYTYNLVEYENLLQTVASKGAGEANKINLASVYNNPLINPFLVKNNFSLSSSTIYYDVNKNSLVATDETAGSRQTVEFFNLPRVVRSDVIMNIAADQERNNKQLFSFDQLAKSIDLNADGADSIEHNALVDKTKEIIKNNLVALSASTDNKIGNYNFTAAPTVSTDAVNSAYLPSNSPYTYFKFDIANSTPLYVLNGNNFKAINANKLVFVDKTNYDNNNSRVVGTYLRLNDVNLTDLNNYITTTYNTANPDFSVSSSRIIRISHSENGTNKDRFVIINGNAATIDSKVLVLYALPKTLTTLEAFTDFNTNADLELLISKVKEDNTNAANIKDLYLNKLNEIINKNANNISLLNKEYDPSNYEITFDYETNKRIINLVEKASKKIVEKILVEVDQTKNPNGFIPDVKRVEWNKTDEESLAFYRLFNSLQPVSGTNQKTASNEILNDPFIKSSIGEIKSGTIEYDRNSRHIIIREQEQNRAVVFYDVPSITTIQDIFNEFRSSNFADLNGFANNNLVDTIIANYAKDSTHNTSYDLNTFIQTIINSKTTGNLKLGDYELVKDAKTYTITERTVSSLDDGPNNSERKYRKIVYKVTDNNNDKNSITIFDDTNYLDTKKAFTAFNSTVGHKEWNDLYNVLASKNNWTNGLEFAELKTTAPELYKKLVTSISNEGFGFVSEDDKTNLDNLPSYLIKDRKIFMVEKNGMKQIIVAGWRNNKVASFDATSNPGEFSILAINELPNIVSEANAEFSLPTIEEVIAQDGDYDKALKQKLESKISQTDSLYTLVSPYTTSDSLKLSKTTLKWEVDSSNDRAFIKLYKGASASSYGSLTVFANSRVLETISTNYIKKTEHKLTYDFWNTFKENSTATPEEKINKLNELVTIQNDADDAFKKFGFTVNSNSGVEVDFDNGKFILYENIANKNQGKIAVVYGVQKVITTTELFKPTANSEEVAIQVLKIPNNGNLVEAIKNKLSNLSALEVDSKILNYSNTIIDKTKAATYNHNTKQITFKNSSNENVIVNLIPTENYIPINQKIFTDPNRYKDLVVNSLKDFEHQEDFSVHNAAPDVARAKEASTSVLANPTKIFKVGTKIVFFGNDDQNMPTYVIFSGSPEIATDVSTGITWLDVYKAIDYTNSKNVFSTNNQEELLLEALKNKDKAEQVQDNKVIIDRKEFDLAKVGLRVNRSSDNENVIKYITVSGNGEVELIVEDSTKIAQLSSATLDSIISLNSKENINKVIEIVKALKDAEQNPVETKDTKKLIDFASVQAQLGQLNNTNKTFDRVWYDESKQVIWFIDSTHNFGHAITGVPSNITVSMDETKLGDDQSSQVLVNSFFALNKMKDYSLRSNEMIENYLSDTSITDKSIAGISLSEPILFEPVAGTNDLYLITYGNTSNRLIVKDNTTYFVEKSNGINGGDKFKNTDTDSNVTEEFKKLYDLLPINETKKYSELGVTNAQLEGVITELGLNKDEIWLVSQIYQNNSIILMLSKNASGSKVYLIHSLPRVAQPSKVKIPTVYSFIKYKVEGNNQDEAKFKLAVKDVLDVSSNKANQNVDIVGISVAWESANVEINKVTKTIKVSSNLDQNTLDTNTFDFLPEYKTLSLSGADNTKVYELIKKIQALSNNSTLDTSTDNEAIGNNRKQKVLEDTVKTDELIAAKITESGFATDFDDLSKVSVEYFLDHTRTKNDKIIFRIFDTNNNLVKALVIDDVARVVKNAANAELNVTEDEFIAAIIEHSDPSKAIDKKLRESRTQDSQSASKLGDLYEYGDSLVVTQSHNNYALTDSNSVYLPVVILNDIDYVPSAASVFDAISDIKKYHAAYKMLEQETNKTKSLNDLNAPELVAFVNDFGGGMVPSEVSVVLKDNKLLFKTTTKVLVGINLPKVLEVTEENDNKVPLFDKIIEDISASQTVAKIYDEFFKNTTNYAVGSDGKIDLTVTNSNNTYKVNVDDLTVKFNDDGSIELSSRKTKEVVYIILKEKNEDLNITPINAAVNDANETYDLVKLLTDNQFIAITDDMKNTSFISQEPSIPTGFFDNTNGSTPDTITIKYLKDQNKILIYNETKHKSIVFYNVARVVEASHAYTIDEVVTADKRLQTFISEDVNKADSKIKQKVKNDKDFDIEVGSESKPIKVTNVGSDNNSTISLPGENSKIQLTILDKTIYHLGFEKISAKNEFTSYVAFDNYQNTLNGSSDFTDIDANAIPNELKRAVFNANYGNIDFSTAKVKRIGTDNSDYKLIFKGSNASTGLEHIVVVYDFPKVYNPTSNNDLPAPSVKQLTSVEGLNANEVYDADAIMENVLKNVLADGDINLDTTKIFHTEVIAKNANIQVNRPQSGQDDEARNYSYSISTKVDTNTTSLVPNAQVPNVYGVDGSRINSDKKDLNDFENKYYELKRNASVDGKVLWTNIKTNKLLASYLTAESILNENAKALLKDDSKTADAYVEFDKQNNRIMVLSEASRFLVIFGNQHKTATNNNAIIADPLNPDNVTNPNPLYKHGEVVAKNGNLGAVIAEKLNALETNDVTVNGYSFKKQFSVPSSANDGVFELSDSNADSSDLYFIDETIYETKDLTTHTFTNLVEFYNKTTKHLESLDKFSEVDTSTVQSDDLTSVIATLGFKSGELTKMVLGGEKLAIIGTDNTTNKTKVYMLELPVVENVDFEISADNVVDAPGNTLEEKLANLVQENLKKKADSSGNVTIAGKQINLNDEGIKYVTETDPSDPNNKIVKVIKDGEVLGTMVMNGNLPNVKTINWSTTNATPLQTWNILWNIIVNNRALDESKPTRKAIQWTDFTNTLSQDKTLFSLDVIKDALTTNNSDAILNENEKSIEYNEKRNEIILRTENSTVIFVGVSKVISANELYDGAKGYTTSQSNEAITPETKSSIEALKEYFNGLDQDFDTGTKPLVDKTLNMTYKVSVSATLENVSTTFKDALTYKYTDSDNNVVYLVDTRQYEPNAISALNDYQGNVASFLALKEKISDSTFTDVSVYNDAVINKYVNENQLLEAKIIKTKMNDTDVFVLVGKKEIQREQVVGSATNQVNELVEFVYLINNLPEIPNDSVYDLLPSDNDVVANGGDQGQLVADALSDPSKFPQTGNPPSIDFGGTKLTMPIASSEVQPDGGIKVTDANGKVIIIPPKANQVVYKEYDVSPFAVADQGFDQDFRFSDILKAKELLDLLDKTEFKKGDEHALSDVFKQNELIKKVLDDYANNYYRPTANKDWNLDNATISYSRSSDSILIKDNNTTEGENPRVVILKNVPKIIYASDLSSSSKDYYIDMANKDNNVVEFLKDKIATIIQNNAGTTSYFVGKSQPNDNNVISGYDKISNPSVIETAYADAPKTWTINFLNEDKSDNNAKLFVVDKTEYITPAQPINFANLIELDRQLKALPKDEESKFTVVNNEEIIAATKQVFGDPLPENITISVIDNGSKLIVLQKDEHGNVVKDFLIPLPKLLDQRRAKLPTKDDVFNSNKPLSELILDNFKDNKKFNPDADGNIDLDGLKFNSNDVEIQTTPEGLIQIIKKGTDPKEVLGTIVANNPIFPQRAIIDNTDELFKLERNPYEIYDLLRLINALPTNVNNFIKLTDEMKAIAWLKNKLDHAYTGNNTWYNSEETRIKYDIDANKIIIDNNDANDNKVLVITNVDRVLKTSDRDYKLYDYVDLAEAYNIENAQAFKADTKTSDEIIKSGIVKALLKHDFEKQINSYKIALKAEHTIETADLEFVAHDNTVYKYADNEPVYKRYIKWTTKDQTYIILDENYVKYSKVDAKQTFRDNIKFKALFEAIIKANNELELTQEVIDNTPEIQAWIDDIRQDTNFDWEQSKTISFASGPNLVLKINKDNIVHIHVLSDIPRVVSEKDIGLNIPNDEDVVKSGGDFAQAILNKINDPAQFPRTADGKITINDTEVDPQNIDVRVREDGSIELYDKTNEHLVISINPSTKQPNYTTTQAVLDDAVVAKELYELIKKTHPLLKSKPKQKALNDQFVDEKDRLMNNAWIKANIIDVYSVENNPANIKTDFSTWSVEYVPNEDKLVFRGKNTDLEKREQVIVVNNAIKVIYASELYMSRDVFKNENKTTSINDALKTTITNSLVDKESIGDYDVLNPVLDTNNYVNNHATADSSQSNEYLQILSNNKSIVIIDNIKYLDSADGYSVFKDLNALNELISVLDFNKGLEIALFNDATPRTALNQELLTHFNSLGSNKNVTGSATVGLFDDFLLITAKDDNNRVFVQKITNLPKVLNKNSIEYVSIDDIVNADGDVALAMANLLKDPNKYKRNENNNIVFNGKEVNPDELIIEVDENNNLVVYEKDASGNKVEPSLAIILTNNADASEPTIKFRKVDGQKYWPSYLQEIISSVYNVEENNIITNIKPLNGLLNNKIIQELIKTDFNLSEQATVEYKLDKNQIIIRDNNQQNQNVIIISTKSLEHSQQTPAQLVEYDSKKDYWMIWVAITSIIGGIGLIMLIGLSIYWFNKKPKASKGKSKK